MIIVVSGARALLEVMSVKAINWISLYTEVSQFNFGAVWEFHNCNRVPFEI